MSEVESQSTEVEQSQETEGLNESTETANKSQEQKASEQKAEAQRVANIKKFLLKVDGQDIETEIDLNDEETLRKQLQLSYAAKKRMAEALEEKKKVYEIAKRFEDVEGYLESLGPKGVEIAERLAYKKYQHEMMTPEQRQYMEMQEKLARYEQMEKQRAEQEEQQRMQALETKYAQEFQQKIISAFQKHEIPASPEMVSRAAQILKKNLELGLDLDADDIAEELKKSEVEKFSKLFAKATPEQLIKLMGEDKLKAVTNYKYNEIKQKQKGLKSLTQSQPAKPPPKSNKKSFQTFDEWMEENDKRVKAET